MPVGRGHPGASQRAFSGGHFRIPAAALQILLQPPDDRSVRSRSNIPMFSLEIHAGGRDEPLPVHMTTAPKLKTERQWVQP
jgi:hypothetical protein